MLRRTTYDKRRDSHEAAGDNEWEHWSNVAIAN
jgi:hypothetical protein